jgi:hypothetical protein
MFVVVELKSFDFVFMEQLHNIVFDLKWIHRCNGHLVEIIEPNFVNLSHLQLEDL